MDIIKEKYGINFVSGLDDGTFVSCLYVNEKVEAILNNLIGEPNVIDDEASLIKWWEDSMTDSDCWDLSTVDDKISTLTFELEDSILKDETHLDELIRCSYNGFALDYGDSEVVGGKIKEHIAKTVANCESVQEKIHLLARHYTPIHDFSEVDGFDITGLDYYGMVESVIGE
jgi:hypothetical protein